MRPTLIGMVVFMCTLGAALLGMWFRTVLPQHYLDAESRGTVQVGVGLIAMMTALVLGLVTASAKSSYDAVAREVKNTAIDVLELDRVLARYGAETGEIRKGLKHVVGVRIDTIWPQGSSKPASLDRYTREQPRELRNSRTQFVGYSRATTPSGRSTPGRWT